jgi:hypothetical protein
MQYLAAILEIETPDRLFAGDFVQTPQGRIRAMNTARITDLDLKLRKSEEWSRRTTRLRRVLANRPTTSL